MQIRRATMADLQTLVDIEAACFPPAEAATAKEIADRLAVYADFFWLLEDKGQTIGFIDGLVTDDADLRDEMYADATLHNPQGKWQMIFGLNTLPEHRCHGYAARLVERVIKTAKEEGRLGVVLTCKKALVHYYAKFGFVDEGVSGSTHGNVVWHQMRVTF